MTDSWEFNFNAMRFGICQKVFLDRDYTKIHCKIASICRFQNTFLTVDESCRLMCAFRKSRQDFFRSN